MRSRIVATGRCVPENLVASESIERELGLEPGWIESRTGVRTRSIAAADQAVSDLAIVAGGRAVDQFQQTQLPAIGTLLLATSTPDHLLPPTAPLVAAKLNLDGIAAMDLAGACCGFLYGLQLADAMAASTGQSVLLIAANILSRRVKHDDVATRALFADAAGAVIVSPTEDINQGVIGHAASSDGNHWQQLLIPGGGSRQPLTASTFEEQNHLMQMNSGNQVFRYAVESMGKLGSRVLSQNSLTIDDVDWWIPHQANMRIIEATRRILKIDQNKTLTTIDRFGNSSAASIPVTLDWSIREQSQVKSGDLVLFTAAGAGLTSGAGVVRM